MQGFAAGPQPPTAVAVAQRVSKQKIWGRKNGAVPPAMEVFGAIAVPPV